MESPYSCNLPALSPEEAKILSKKHVCVIGCGGLGGYVLEMLARIGIGSLTAADPDIFCEKNLNHQLFATTKTIGISKTEAARLRLHTINPSVSFYAVPLFLDDENADNILKGHDVIVDALDNLPSRLILEKYCRKLSIPLVHGAAEGWCGQVSTILPGDNSFSLIYQSDTVRDSVSDTLPFAAAAAASFQCAEVVKLLLKKGEVLSKQLLWLDLLHGDCSVLQLG